MEFFNNYQARLRFSQVMRISMIQTQDIFEYLDREFDILDIDNEREASTEELDNAYEEGYEEGWESAVAEMELAMPSKYGHIRRR